MLDTTHKSQLTLLIEARVKCSERERRYFARVNSNCSWAGVAKTRLAVERHPFFFFLPSVDLLSIAKYLEYETDTYTQNGLKTIHMKWSRMSIYLLREVTIVYIHRRARSRPLLLLV